MAIATARVVAIREDKGNGIYSSVMGMAMAMARAIALTVDFRK